MTLGHPATHSRAAADGVPSSAAWPTAARHRRPRVRATLAWPDAVGRHRIRKRRPPGPGYDHRSGSALLNNLEFRCPPVGGLAPHLDEALIFPHARFPRSPINSNACDLPTTLCDQSQDWASSGCTLRTSAILGGQGACPDRGSHVPWCVTWSDAWVLSGTGVERTAGTPSNLNAPGPAGRATTTAAAGPVLGARGRDGCRQRLVLPRRRMAVRHPRRGRLHGQPRARQGRVVRPSRPRLERPVAKRSLLSRPPQRRVPGAQTRNR